MQPLIDTFGRVHTNLRISVTDRCNIRCFYCMPADNVQFMERSRAPHVRGDRAVRARGGAAGLCKIRLTGGEPLVRRNLHVLVRKLAAVEGIDDIGLTTNGILLAEQAQELYDAGLRRINISLDALDPQKFEKITRRQGYEKVIAGIQAAQAVGFDPVKVNAVAVRGLTEDEIVPFGHFARRTGVEIRFIEFMPLDADNAWQREKVLFAHEIVETLERDIMPLVPRAGPGPARSGERIRLRGRRRQDRLHRLGQPAVLHELRPVSHHGRRQAPQLPVQPRRNRRQGYAADGGGRRRDRAGDPRQHRRQEGRARDQHGPVHPARTPDVLDWRLKKDGF